MGSDEKKKVNAVMIVEVLGRPAEYLTETLNEIIKKIREEKGVAVLGTKVNEPVEMKEQKGFYSSFAEIEVDVDEILYLAILMFKYMPAHVEIISPQTLALSNFGWNDIFNEIVRRLHGYEEIARILQTEKKILENQLRTIVGNQEEKLVEKTEDKIKEKKKIKIKKPKTKKEKKE